MPLTISRQEAADQGLKRYYTGVPCKRGHDSERFVANTGCVQCMQFTTPNKRRGAKASNVGWPRTGLVFFCDPRPLPEEMEAAFRYIEAMRWHDHAVMELRKDPALMMRFAVPLKPEQIAKLDAELAKQQRILSANLQRLQGEGK